MRYYGIMIILYTDFPMFAHNWHMDNRVFPKIDYYGSSARIVLEQNKFSKKKLPLTGIEPVTLGL